MKDIYSSSPALQTYRIYILQRVTAFCSMYFVVPKPFPAPPLPILLQNRYKTEKSSMNKYDYFLH